MKKYILVLMALCTLFLAGCKKTEINGENLAKDLLSKISFEDELTKVDSQTARKLYSVENDLENHVYISSGATAEEIAIFKFKDKKAADKGYEAANERIKQQKTAFENYVPKEIKKLDNAAIIKKDNYLIVCICGEDNVVKIINEFIK